MRSSPSQWRRRWLAAAAVVIAGGASAIFVSQAEAAVPPPPSGMSLVFSDDFTGAAGTGLNRSNWLYSLGTGYPGGAANWGTGEVDSARAIPVAPRTGVPARSSG